MHKKESLITIAMILSIVIALFLIAGCGAEEMAKQKYKKVLVIGIDGMDPQIVSKLMSEGKLPNLKRLSETGTFMELGTSYPPHSPVAWTSMATGVNPGKHNIFDFIRRNPTNNMPELSLAKSVSGIGGTDYKPYVRADPFWKITSEAGIPSTVIRWPVTFPAEEVKGNLLAGLGVPDLKGFLSGYTFYTTGDVKEDASSSHMEIQVVEKDGVIETEIYGPRTTKLGSVISVRIPVKIVISSDRSSASITVRDNVYNIKAGSWSSWMKGTFKIGLLKEVTGTFKAYLASAEPFEMYLTSVQIDPEQPVVAISYPKDYSAELAEEIGLYYTLGMPEESDGYVDEKIDSEAFQAQMDEIESERDKMFWSGFEDFKSQEKGLYSFVYDTSDRMQHCYWDEKALAEDAGVLSVNPVVVDYYINKDKFVGKVLDELDNKTALLIVSDHGFTSFERAVDINRWLYENGYIALKDGAEITAEDDGSLFKHVDWNKTKAFSVGFNSIYINTKGRESKGSVKSSDKDNVINEIVTKLEAMKDEKTGKNPINKAYKSREIHSGKYLNDAPDIIIGFSPGYRMGWKTAVGGFDTQVISDNIKKWNGDHLVDPKFVPGVLFSNMKLSRKSANQMDVAATVLDVFGIGIPSGMDGKSLVK